MTDIPQLHNCMRSNIQIFNPWICLSKPTLCKLCRARKTLKAIETLQASEFPEAIETQEVIETPEAMKTLEIK